MAIFLHEKEGKGRKGEKVSAFFPRLRSYISPLFFTPAVTPPPRIWCFIGERSRELFPFCYRYLPPPLLPPGPDEINDDINDTALNIGDQPVSSARLDGGGIDSRTRRPSGQSKSSFHIFPFPLD